MITNTITQSYNELFAESHVFEKTFCENMICTVSSFAYLYIKC